MSHQFPGVSSSFFLSMVTPRVVQEFPFRIYDCRFLLYAITLQSWRLLLYCGELENPVKLRWLHGPRDLCLVDNQKVLEVIDSK